MRIKYSNSTPFLVAALIAAILCLMMARMLHAQQSGPFTITSTQYAPIGTDRMATVYIQVTGTWSGTLSPKVSVAGQTPVAIQVFPAASSTAQSSITASGAYYAKVGGYTYFELRGNTVSSGTAKVYLNASPASH